MRWLVVCLSVCTAAAAVELRCHHPLCVNNGDIERNGGQTVTVEGHEVTFGIVPSRNFHINCGGWQALDSPAMPSFPAEVPVSTVVLSNCTLPAGNGSLATALAALNVVLQPVDNKLSFRLLESPGDYLAAHHFVGLQSVTYLKIHSEVDPHQRQTAEAGFLSEMRNLRTMQIVGVQLPAGEIYRFPHSLRDLSLGGESLSALSGTLPQVMSEMQRALPNLQYLMLDQLNFTFPEFTESMKNDVNLQLNTKFSLKSMYVLSWQERRLEPMQRCDSLSYLEITQAKVEELPDRWIAACTHLKELDLDGAEQLTSLPAKLLEGATALRRLSITSTMIQSLPDGFFKGALNLLDLDLSSNRLRGALPSDIFLGPQLHILSLEGNKLLSSTLPALAPLTSLTKLSLAKNEYMLDFCEENGYSLLRNLTQLKVLSLSETKISRICRDWRENFTLLETLSLIGTSITELQSTDFLFTRNATTEYAEVELSTSVSRANFTKADYERSLTASGPGVTFRFESSSRYPQKSIDCDCSTYWLRRAADENRPIRIEGLPCANGRDFKQMPAEEMCPVNERNTA